MFGRFRSNDRYILLPPAHHWDPDTLKLADYNGHSSGRLQLYVSLEVKVQLVWIFSRTEVWQCSWGPVLSSRLSTLRV